MTDHVLELSHVVQDYLKTIWQATEWGGRPATTSYLASRFNTTQANVSDTLRRLTDAGLVTREPYRPASLTAAGEQFALAMVRRHRLIETYLVSALGYDYTEVHDEAERLEHAASDTFIDRIDALLGHPQTDPHGDPIPSPTGSVHYPSVAIKATDASPGRYQVVRISDADPEALSDIHKMAIQAGTTVLISNDDGLRLRRCDQSYELSHRGMAAIWVAPEAS